jgi:putative transposase
MILENDYDTIMNHKYIRRIMKKYNLFTKVRKSKPYAKTYKDNYEHRTLPNLLKREFNQDEVGKVLLTDITYLYYGNGQRAYLSAVKDVASREIVSYQVSKSIDINIVLKTIKNLEKSKNFSIYPNSIIHSDQGYHYTSLVYQNKVKALGLSQSMSRKGNCLDNAPMESFFGHMKDEMQYKEAKTFKELSNIVDKYIKYYNFDRYQWNLEKMSPVQYRNHLLIG